MSSSLQRQVKPHRQDKEEQQKVNMRETRIEMDRLLLKEIQSHATSSYPEECCGLLLGSFVESDDSVKKEVARTVRMNNVYESAERYHRYTIDPKAFLAKELEAEGKGKEVVGVYHSHPNAPAKPSQFDLDHAWPTLSYVVVEVREGKPAETASWVLREDRSEFVPEHLQILTS